MWDASKCDFCGDCLVACRYAGFDRDQAVQVMKLLAEGKAADILDRCITCVACTNVCPTGADPSDLIFMMQEKIGTAPLVVNTKPVYEALAKGLEGQGTPVEMIPGDPNRLILSFDSFEYKQFPEGTLESRLFKGMTVVRGQEYMSLTGCVHMGGQSFVRKYAARVIGKLAELGQDIVYIHNEGYALAKVKSKELGLTVPYKFQHLYEYLLEYLKNHREDIKPLNKKVAYQANCATRWLPEQEPWLDEIFGLIGVERPSRKYAGIDALCCSGPIIGTNRDLAVDIQEKNIKDALDCGAEALITMCPVCDAVMRRPTSRAGLPKIFVTDLVRMALGEIPWPK
jgi:Fe-S oxidoreductase